MTGKNSSFERYLIENKILTDQQMAAAKTVSDKYGYRTASAIVMAGIWDEATAAVHLSRFLGIDAVVLEKSAFELDKVLVLIPEQAALAKLALPLVLESRSLTMALANPTDIMLIDELAFLTGKRIVPLLALEKSLKETIPLVYAMLKQGKEFYKGKKCSVDKTHIEIVSPKLKELETAASELKKELPPESEIKPLYVETVPVLPPDVSVPTADSLQSAVPETPKTSDQTGYVTDNVRPVKHKIETVPAVEAPAQPASSTIKDRPTILVVDDDKLTQTYLADHLRRFFIVDTREDGQEAMLYLKKNMPDLIILDGMLPGIHGFELCKSLKESEKFKHIPIIVTSAKYGGWEVRQDIINNYGADEFIEKPFNLVELTNIINALLEKKISKEKEKISSLSSSSNYTKDILLMLKEGKIDSGIDLCKKAIASDPLSAEYHHLMGILLEKKGNDFEAIEELEKAASINPKHFNALRRLAGIYQRKKLTHKAIDTWLRAAGAAPNEEIKEKIKQHLLKAL